MAAPAFWAYGVVVGLCVRCEELRRLSVLNLVRSVLNHLRDAAWRRDAVHLVGVELGVLAALTASLAFAGAPGPKDAAIAKVTRGEMSAEAFARLTAGMDPAMLALAGRFDSRTAAFAAQGAQLTEAADAGAPPEETGILRLQDMTPDEARIWNANNPTSTLPNPPAKPFHLKTSGMLDEARALDCMTAALYYEARWESVDAQRAAAQVVLNRLRHPAYPKTVCGVVFEGSNLKTGCQFSFTCDGSMRGQPIPAVWARARTLAEAALNGYVMRKVGTATHYHAVYVAPYWSPNLVKVSTIGAHIFYRWTGSWGRPPAFSGRYEGGEVAGMQIAALDKVAGQARLDAAPVAEVGSEAPAMVLAAADHAGKPADAHASDAPAPEPLKTVNDVAPKAEVVPAEELDWAGRPKKATPRLAMPSQPF